MSQTICLGCLRKVRSCHQPHKLHAIGNMFFLSRNTNRFLSTTSSRFRDYLNHYETLGISHTAEPKEIKEAYLTLSKQLHPDVLNGNESAKVKAEVNARYLAVSEAYAVLSKPKDRRIYDLGLPRQRSGEEEGEESQTGRSTQYREATFEERRRAAGFRDPDPNYFKGNAHFKVAAGCLLFAFYGFLVHMAIAKMLYEKHNRTMTERTTRLTAEYRDYQDRMSKMTKAELKELIDGEIRRGEERMRGRAARSNDSNLLNVFNIQSIETQKTVEGQESQNRQQEQEDHTLSVAVVAQPVQK